MAKTIASADHGPSSCLMTPVPLRVVTCCVDEEKRTPTTTGGDDNEWDPAAVERQCSPTSDDERSAAIPSTAELQPLEQPSSTTIQLAIQTLRDQDDWLQQHEAITTLRRCLVHHTSLLTDSDLDAVVPALVVACDNLRSALSKNALVALSESFEYLDCHRMVPFLATSSSSSSSSVVPLVDVLLRRAICEKRFLRDAAMDAVDNLIMFLACPQLITSVTTYANSKSAKLVATASMVVAKSFARLKALQLWDVEQFASREMHAVYQVLAKFRVGKDSAARGESMASLRMLGDALGKDRFHATLLAALPDATQSHTVTSILVEVFPPPVNGTTMPGGRRGSLKDRMLIQQQVTPSQPV